MTVRPPRLPDLESLDLLVAIAETGSLGQAAARLGVSQPAASLRLRGLERRAGLVLVERTPTGSTPTAAGRQLVDWATPLLEQARGFAKRVDDLGGSHPVTLRIAASLTVVDHLLPDWLRLLQEQSPNVVLSLDPMNSERVVEAVRTGTADLGYVEGAGAPPGVRSRVVGSDALVLVVAPGHPFATADGGVTPEKLAATPLVLREQGSGSREVLDRALAAHGLAATSALQIGSTGAMKAALAGGDNAAVISRLSVLEEVRAGILVAVPTPGLDLRRRFRAIWRAGSVPAGPAATLLAISASGGDPLAP